MSKLIITTVPVAVLLRFPQVSDCKSFAVRATGKGLLRTGSQGHRHHAPRTDALQLPGRTEEELHLADGVRRRQEDDSVVLLPC